MRRQVLLNWKAGNTFGWGLLGFGIALHWGSDSDIQAIMGLPMGPNDFPCMDPVRAMALGPTVLASQQFLSELEMGRLNLRKSRVMVMDALSNGFLGPNLQHYGLHNVGRCVFEDTRVEAARHRLTKYDSLLCASHWNAGMLQTISNTPVAMLHEGVDQSQFFPGPKSGLFDPNRFYVFSGGKIEFRKAHDLVLLAFREFAARHDDVVLVAAWHSPWPQVSAGFQGKALAPLNRDSRGELDLQRWVSDNGIPAGQFVELPRIPNSMMPGILREMDCAVQISRCEPCTNLPAKEAMACGVPVILADNTGTRDLIDTDNCLALRSQGIVAGPVDVGTDGWGETSVDELVTAFEALYGDTQRRKRIGARGAQWIIEHQRTWRDHASSLKHHLLGLFGAA